MRERGELEMERDAAPSLHLDWSVGLSTSLLMASMSHPGTPVIVPSFLL